MIEPKNITVDGKNYIIYKFPATVGREILCNYPTSAVPKIGDYATNERMMYKILAHVAVQVEGRDPIQLINRDLIDNHVGNWESLMKLEKEVIEYNCSFFQNGRLLGFLETIAQSLPQWITKTLTDSLQQLSQTGKPASTN